MNLAKTVIWTRIEDLHLIAYLNVDVDIQDKPQLQLAPCDFPLQSIKDFKARSELAKLQPHGQVFHRASRTTSLVTVWSFGGRIRVVSLTLRSVSQMMETAFLKIAAVVSTQTSINSTSLAISAFLTVMTSSYTTVKVISISS